MVYSWSCSQVGLVTRVALLAPPFGEQALLPRADDNVLNDDKGLPHSSPSRTTRARSLRHVALHDHLAVRWLGGLSHADW